ncbi:MAG: heavy-metal-associated domain-containing protein [Pyrinomonadaceae bacterium]
MNNRTTLTAPDIVCGGCAGAIKNAVGRIQGVSAVDVDVETKRVTVDHDADVTQEELAKVLDDAGFPSS